MARRESVSMSCVIRIDDTTPTLTSTVALDESEAVSSGKQPRQDMAGVHAQEEEEISSKRAEESGAQLSLPPFGHKHYSHRSPQLRAALLGANDGLVSTASLMVGVGAAAQDVAAMTLGGVAGLVAGALAMAAGEYVSVASQRDSERADVEREREELQKSPEHARWELEELAHCYQQRGLSETLARAVAEEIHANDLDVIVRAHALDELGINVDDLADPWQASWTSALSFASGAALPLLAGAFIHDFFWRMVSVTIVTTVALAVFGAVGAALGGATLWRGSVRVLIGGWIAMAGTYGVGRLFGVAVS